MHKKGLMINCSWSDPIKTCCFNRVLVSKNSMAPIQWLIRDFKKARRDVLKACVPYFHQIFIFSPNGSPSKTIKNAFYFI